ncbi:hypothetical protein AMS68_007791 [Peltaster fructicola]|uniref:Lytic polysaccharide monooxygenase n=1 Tax=Peltaster fructicola TaxID=286661 RepID=A0A6H0Y5I4_9PEZI|nr:hypothetical protein AMS68_007791 [Peltaster fructicola]
MRPRGTSPAAHRALHTKLTFSVYKHQYTSRSCVSLQVNMHYYALLSVLAGTGFAHMVIKSPVPYGQSSLTNGPLAADGSDFPCKQRAGVYDITKMNSMAVGVPQELSFMGSAVHGGGSCQVSVTLDEKPTKDSQFKVIHSIIGGCPSNVTGNLPEDANGNLAGTFQFQVPTGFPNGKATLAWSWLNKVGNREFYMNCAPIEVSGGSDSKDVFNSLPDMFVANIPATTCGTTENEDFVYPNPGDSVETRFSTALGSKTLGSSCQTPTQGSNAGAQKPAVANSIPVSAPSSLPTVSAAYTQSAAGSVAAPSTTVAALATTTTAVAIPTTTAAAVSVAPVATVSTAPSSGNSTCASGSVSCPQPGSIICVSSSQFGLCDINNCAIVQAVALGTTCSGGVISRRSVDRHLARHLGFHKRN